MQIEKITIMRSVTTDSKVLIITSNDLTKHGKSINPNILDVNNIISSCYRKVRNANYVFYEDEHGKLYCIKHRYPIKYL